MQKVFITGITGFLGDHLAKKMFEAGWFVAGNDNFLGSIDPIYMSLSSFLILTAVTLMECKSDGG